MFIEKRINMIKDFNIKYRKFENVLDIGIIFENNLLLSFYTHYKSIYRTYWYINHLNCYISFKVKENNTKLVYIYFKNYKIYIKQKIKYDFD